jgi:hypothetical protein
MNWIIKTIQWLLRNTVCPHIYKKIGQVNVHTYEFKDYYNVDGVKNWWSVGKNTCYHYQCAVCGNIVDSFEYRFDGGVKDYHFRSKNAVI